MKVRLIKSWQTQLADTIAAPYFDRLTQFVRQEYKQYSCYPPGKDLFNAFDLCPFEAVNVVLLGLLVYLYTVSDNVVIFIYYRAQE